MRKDFFPKREDQIVAWSGAFGERLLASYAEFGVSQPEAEQFWTLRTAFADAYIEWSVAQAAGIRSKALTSSKLDAKAALEADARRLSRLIHAFRGITTAQLSSLGLCGRIGGGKNPAIGAPTSRPNLWVVSVVNRTVTVRLSDADGPFRRGRPRGVIGAAVFTHSKPGINPGITPSGWTFSTYATGRTVDVTFPDDVAPGQTVFLTAHWLSPRLEPGPLGNPIQVNIQGGGVSNLGQGLSRAA